MSSTHICSTRRGSFDALRFQGILVTESYAQIDSIVRKSLSEEHALLFAEPVHERSGDYTDWYSARKGKPVRLIDLPEEQQQIQKRRIAVLASDIKGLADSLVADASQAKQVRGKILTMALLCPTLDHIYVLDGQPVLTAWGFGPAGTGAQPEDMVRLGAAASIASATGKAFSEPLSETTEVNKTVSAPVASGWLGSISALLLGILAALALYFLFCMLFGPAGCVSPGFMPRGCSGPLCPDCPPELSRPSQESRDPSADPKYLADLDAEKDKGVELEKRLHALRAQLAERMAECSRPPAKPVEVPKPAVPSESPGLVEKPVETPQGPAEEKPAEDPVEQPPSLAELMPSTPEPPVAPKETPRENLKPGEEMRIPENARQSNDLSFLEGCWTSESGLVSTRGEPVKVEYCFDSSGTGTRSISETRNNTHCSGSVKAHFDDNGKLIFDAKRSACNSGGAYVPQRVDCAPDNDGKAQCYGTGKSGRRWQAVFRRR